LDRVRKLLEQIAHCDSC